MADKIEELEKIKRQAAIFTLIQSRNFRTQKEIVKALDTENIYCKQSTVSRDIREMRIDKNPDSGVYRITPATLQGMHREKLQTLLNENTFSYTQHVATHYMKVEKGKASLYAFHLQQAFPAVILEVTIGIDSLVLLINLDVDTKGFFDMLNNS